MDTPGVPRTGKSQKAVENREKWRKLVAKSSVVPQMTLAVKRLIMMMMMMISVSNLRNSVISHTP